MNKPRNSSREEMNMNEPYLWDGSGEPDPEVQRLESLLAQFSHREIPLALPLPENAAAKPGYFDRFFLQFPWAPASRRRCCRAVLCVDRGWHRFFLPDTRVAVRPGAGRWRGSMGLRKSTRDSSPQASPRRSFASVKLWSSTAPARQHFAERIWAEIRVGPNSRVRLLATNRR